MPPTSTVYKVVLNNYGNLISAFSPYTSCDYGVNTRTVSFSGTPLLAFSRREYAEHFMQDMGLAKDPYEIWEAEAENARHIETVCLSSCARRQREFWAGLLHSRYWHSDAPKGTMACDSITLTKHIPWEEP
jgi:hypothetical protein